MSLDTNFRYELGGNLAPIDDPLEGAPNGEDVNAGLNRLGFALISTLGDEHGLNMEVHASTGDNGRWMLVPADNFSYCLIEVIGWPAYLDALARYSPIYSKPIV